MSAPRKWTVVATLNDATLVAVKALVVGKTHVVTKVVSIITTHANAKFIRVQDSAGTPVIMFHQHDLTAAAGVPDVKEVNYSFASKTGGYPGTISKAINVVSEASGPAGKVLVEGYTY